MGKHRLEDRELKESARPAGPTTTRRNPARGGSTVYHASLDGYAMPPAPPRPHPVAQQPAGFPETDPDAGQPQRQQRVPRVQQPVRSLTPIPRAAGRRTDQFPPGPQPSPQVSPRQRPTDQPSAAHHPHTVRDQHTSRQTVRTQPAPVHPARSQPAGYPQQAEAQRPAGKAPSGRAGTKRRTHALPSLRRKKDDLFERSFKLCTRCGEHVYVLASSCKHCDAVA